MTLHSAASAPRPAPEVSDDVASPPGTGAEGIVASGAESPRVWAPVAGELPIVLVRSHEHNYSETFLEDHVNFLTRNLTLLYGFPFPRFLKGGRSVLSGALEQRIGATLATPGAAKEELWRDYSGELAGFLGTCGAKSVLVDNEDRGGRRGVVHGRPLAREPGKTPRVRRAGMGAPLRSQLRARRGKSSSSPIVMLWIMYRYLYRPESGLMKAKPSQSGPGVGQDCTGRDRFGAPRGDTGGDVTTSPMA
jgi:hypothetical protein